MHALDAATDYRPADTPVLAYARAAWRSGRVTAWHRTPAGWLAQVVWRTGPPVYSSCVDFLPATQLRDAEACLHCQVASTRWRRHLTAAAAGAGPAAAMALT